MKLYRLSAPNHRAVVRANNKFEALKFAQERLTAIEWKITSAIPKERTSVLLISKLL